MIYQCYAREEDKSSLFPAGPYEGFGLEPEVNDTLFLNCPELEDPKTRMALTEYACFLWHWRNQSQNPDPWFGTTSFKQLEKGFTTTFISEESVSALLEEHQILGWGEYHSVGMIPGGGGQPVPVSLALQAEVCHPHINDFISEAFSTFGHEVPRSWEFAMSGFFANYWAMKNELFNEYMEFSWPMVEWALENVEDSEFCKNQPTFKTVSKEKAVGYFMERLFILWYLMKRTLPHNHTGEALTVLSHVE